MHKASKDVQKAIRRAKRNWNEYYILKMDVTKYFQNIDKRILWKILKRKIKDRKLLWLTRTIRVNTVSPSLTITPLALQGWTEQEIEEHKQNNPLKRLGETIDIANAVLFLLSDNASYINGENLNVNGGSLLK